MLAELAAINAAYAAPLVAPLLQRLPRWRHRPRIGFLLPICAWLRSVFRLRFSRLGLLGFAPHFFSYVATFNHDHSAIPLISSPGRVAFDADY